MWYGELEFTLDQKLKKFVADHIQTMYGDATALVTFIGVNNRDNGCVA